MTTESPTPAAGRSSVFRWSASIIAVIAGIGAVFPKRFGALASDLQGWIVAHFGWLYVLSMTGFVVVASLLAIGRWGHVKLGPDDAEPEFPRATWFAMLFSAGMGIGLVFFSVAEPVLHFTKPAPPVTRAGGLDAARNAMGLTFFHWGLHPWAVYALIGLALAYFGFRKKLPLQIRSLFHPILGDRIRGPIGDVIDVLAVVATLFGVATSLGLGAMQVNAGLNHVLGVAEGTGIQVGLIAGITALATISVVTGLKKGVRRLSELNMMLALSLLVFVFLFGPTRYLCNSLVENIGAYVQTLPVNSFWTASQEPDGRAWLGSWTVFYWAWWIAWSPFVGMFIARISYGRTVREFLVATLLGPTVAGFVWLTIFGSSAIKQVKDGTGLDVAVSESIPRALFVFLEHYPMSTLTAGIGTLVIVLFFVTSSDSASMVIDIISSNGNPEPPVATRVFWAVTEGVVAIVLLLAGGLKALQTAAIATGLPFCFVLIMLCFGLVKALREDPAVVDRE